MINLGTDLRCSIRTLTANPGFSVMTILMLARGIGACTAIFTVANAVLLRPPAHPDSKSLVQYKGASTRVVRRILLVGQIGLTVMLVAGAGLLGRSLLRVLQVDLGFQTESRIAVDVLLPRERGDKTRQRDADRFEQILDRTAMIRGVSADGGTEQLPLGGGGANGPHRRRRQ